MAFKTCKIHDIKFRGLKCCCCSMELKAENDAKEIMRLNECLMEERNLRLALRHKLPEKYQTGRLQVPF